MSNVRLILTLFILGALFLMCGGKGEKETEGQNVRKAYWPIFRGDSRLSGISNDTIPDEMRLLWTFKTESKIISSPIIGLGRTYIGSTDGKIYAIDLLKGAEAWEFDTGDDIEASPLLLEGSIYIGSLSGDFFCLDANSGNMLWKYEIKDEIYGSANWAQISEGGEKVILVGSYDNKMYCFDADNGNLRWTYETDSYINGAPATDGENVVFGGCDEYLHIVSVKDGTKNGEVWVASYIAGSAALVDNRAYLGHYDNKLVCVDILNREIVWEFENQENGGPFFASPAVGENRVLIGSRDRFLYCVDRTTGQKIWSFATRDEIDSSPVIAGNKVVTASTDGRLYIVDLDSGQEIWSYEIGAAVFGCPAVAGGKIVIGANDGRVYAFGDDL